MAITGRSEAGKRKASAEKFYGRKDEKLCSQKTLTLKSLDKILAKVGRLSPNICFCAEIFSGAFKVL